MIAYLTDDERKLFKYLAREVYTGKREIIDAGAFLGGSAKCFALGLEQNINQLDKSGRIHSFDIFRYANWVNPKIVQLQNYKLGDSFLSNYHDNISTEFEHLITLHLGEIFKRDWKGGKIEILMLDCIKSHKVSDHCMRIFFPHLIEGGFIIQQDYGIASRLHWIHSSMFLLKDFFEFYGIINQGGSTVFKVKKVPDLSEVNEVIKIVERTDLKEISKKVAAFIKPYSERASEAVLASSAEFLSNPF